MRWRYFEGDMKRYGCSIIWSIIRVLAWKYYGKQREASSTVAGLQAKKLIQYLPEAKWES
jgi:hypothetical protein